MRQQWVLGGHVLVMVLGLDLLLAAPAFASSGACEQIKMACPSAGFIEGGGRAGDGLEADCFAPIVRGTPQPNRASRPLPQVDPRLAGACRAAIPGTDVQPAQSAAQRDGGGSVVRSPIPVEGGAPNGLVAVLVNKPGQSFDSATFNNPYIRGVALQIHWSDIEPVKGKPDWSKLDELFADASASNKWVQLLIFPGFFSPGWALDGVKTDQFPLQYGPGKGKVETLPMPWDQVYLDRWFAFLKELSDKYGNSAAFRLVGADGPTSVSAEATLPNSGADLKKWKSDGYTPSKYIDAWKSVFRTYAADFPNQFISLSLGSGLAIDDKGKIDAGQNSITKQDVVDLANAILRRRFTLQYSNLDGLSHPDVQGGMAFVAGYEGRAVTGFQMRASASGKAMGDNGDPPPVVLRKAIDKGMQTNSAGKHVNYLEVYEPDVLADDMQPVLGYGASLFAPRPPVIPRSPCGTRCQ